MSFNNNGYWGAVTSAHDWCEENYVYSHYIAEFWNSMSSLFIAFVGFWGMKLTYQENLNKRYYVCYFALCVVGFGSAAFHGTLLYTGQILDELPMVWTSLAYVYAIKQRKGTNVTAALALTLYAAVFTIAYLSMKTGWFYFFLASYCCVILHLAYVGYQLQKQADKNQQWAFKISFFAYFGGSIFFWIPEVLFCSVLQPLQLHAWFHLTSAIGSYSFVIFIASMQMKELKREHCIVRGVLPTIQVSKKLKK